MAFSTLATGAFVGWQSWNLNETLNNPFEANLQDRQIEICATTIRAKEEFLLANEFLSPDEWWNRFPFGRSGPTDGGDGTGDAAPTFPIENKEFSELFEGAVSNLIDQRFQRIAESESIFRESLAELKIYADERTTVEIDGVVLALGIFSIKFGFEVGGDATEPLQKRLNTAFEPLQKKCKQVMLGEKKGLI